MSKSKSPAKTVKMRVVFPRPELQESVSVPVKVVEADATSQTLRHKPGKLTNKKLRQEFTDSALKDLEKWLRLHSRLCPALCRKVARAAKLPFNAKGT
jgi:hypothetical protein